MTFFKVSLPNSCWTLELWSGACLEARSHYLFPANKSHLRRALMLGGPEKKNGISLGMLECPVGNRTHAKGHCDLM